jgi:hypothetical protein
MIPHLKTFLKKRANSYYRFINKYYQKYIMLSYDKKRILIKEYRLKNNSKIFIETGTFLGDTIDLLKNDFEKLISFELSEELAIKAKKRFTNDINIKILHGDSGKLLANVLNEISDPCLFWLDGHYSSEFWIGDEFIRTAKGDKDTPILEELKAILKHPIKNHIILIDDARCFTGKGDYPKIREIKKKIKDSNPNYHIKVKNDIIRISPTI